MTEVNSPVNSPVNPNDIRFDLTNSAENENKLAETTDQNLSLIHI